MVEAFPRKNFRNWVAETQNESNSLDISSELRQHHSGSALWNAILLAVLDKFNPALMCAVRDWTPCDDQLALAVHSAHVEHNFNCTLYVLYVLHWD